MGIIFLITTQFFLNISAISDVGTVGLDKDNENYLGNSLNLTLSAGSYIFRANVSGNENYSNIDYKYYNITINKATSINSFAKKSLKGPITASLSDLGGITS